MLLEDVWPFIVSFIATVLLLGSVLGICSTVIPGHVEGARTPSLVVVDDDDDVVRSPLKPCDMVVIEMPCGALTGGLRPVPQSRPFL